MRRFIAFFLLFVGSGLAMSAQDAERRYARSFAAPTESVVLKVTRGVVEVESVPADAELRVEVLLRLQRKDSENQRGVFDRLTPDLLAPLKRDVDGAFASLEPRYKADARKVEMIVRDSREIVFDADPTLQMIIEVKAWVPAGRRLEVRGVAAGVTIARHEGSVLLRGESGSYFVGTVTGDLEARTNSGSITVTEVGGRSELRTISGNILAGRLRGPARLEASSGAIEVQQAFDGLKIRGDDSEVIVGLADPLPKSVDLSTSSGTITLNVDRNLPLTVDAATRLLGKVRTRGLEPVVRSGSLNESALLADFNGGGVAVRLRTSWGNILVLGREPLDS